MKNSCRDCGAPIVGRADKKFCGPHCRSNFHNSRTTNNSKVVKKINRILTKNRTILERLRMKNLKVLDRTDLVQEGFDFRYYTRKKDLDDGSSFIFCYDTGYTVLDNRRVALISKRNII